MGAVKNHFHDEICAEADEARERGDRDEPAATGAGLTPHQVWDWGTEIYAKAAVEAKYAEAYAHRPNDAMRYRREQDRLTARADFLRRAWSEISWK